MPEWTQDLLFRQFPVLGVTGVVVYVALRYTHKRFVEFLAREEKLIERFEKGLKELGEVFDKAIDKLDIRQRDEFDRLKRTHDTVVRAKIDEIRRLREDLKQARGE